jgi:hypothetical protein
MNIKRRLKMGIVFDLLFKKPFAMYICLLIIG